MRIAVLIFAGVAVAGLMDWGLDKVWSPSKVRSALLTGVGVYVALTISDLFLR